MIGLLKRGISRRFLLLITFLLPNVHTWIHLLLSHTAIHSIRPLRENTAAGSRLDGYHYTSLGFGEPDSRRITLGLVAAALIEGRAATFFLAAALVPLGAFAVSGFLAIGFAFFTAFFCIEAFFGRDLRVAALARFRRGDLILAFAAISVLLARRVPILRAAP